MYILVKDTWFLKSAVFFNANKANPIAPPLQPNWWCRSHKHILQKSVICFLNFLMPKYLSLWVLNNNKCLWKQWLWKCFFVFRLHGKVSIWLHSSVICFLSYKNVSFIPFQKMSHNVYYRNLAYICHNLIKILINKRKKRERKTQDNSFYSDWMSFLYLL